MMQRLKNLDDNQLVMYGIIFRQRDDFERYYANICGYYATNNNESDIRRYILKSYCDGSV